MTQFGAAFFISPVTDPRDRCASIAEHLMRQIMHYDKEFRREVATSAAGSIAKH
jgi:hypothetical protein